MEKIKRSICIFPTFDNGHEIEKIRRQYDPLYGLIDPHITLVFPFSSPLSKTQLVDHTVQALANFPPFPIRLQGITATPDRYLFLNVKEGNDQLNALHDNLYSGILRSFHSRHFTYLLI